MGTPRMETPTMSLMNRIVAQMLRELMNQELLELAPGTTVEDLESDLVSSMSQAPGFSQATPYLAERLVTSEKVSELYASNDQLRQILRNLDL